MADEYFLKCHSFPNPDIEIVIASEMKQSRPFAMRLPRTLRVLAMTDCEKVFVF
jgi:hypothetical protein